jgi:thiol-disulfide isomerase/thioredoxin
MTKKNSILVCVVALLFTAACSTGKQNIIKGKIDGLEIGDRIILLVEDPEGSVWTAWTPVDSTVVTKAGEFTLKTKVGDCDVKLIRVKAGEKYAAANSPYPPCFLDAYATLHITGSVDNWRYLKIIGGLYDYPDMQEIKRITDSGLTIQNEGVALLEQLRKTADIALQSKAIALIDQSNDILSSTKALEKEFVKNNPDKAYSARLIRNDNDLRKDVDKYEEAFLALSPAVQNSRAGVLVKSDIAGMRASVVGVTAPDFSLTALDGQEVTLSNYRGKYILLDFWGSWCGPCRESSPLLVALYTSLKEKEANIEFIGIACDDHYDADWIAAIERDHLAWIHLNDAHSKGKSIQKQYGVLGVPTCILISPEGTIVYKEHPVRIIPKVKALFEKDTPPL